MITPPCRGILTFVSSEHRLNLLTDVAGISVGNAHDLRLGSGVTVIVFDQPAVGSVSVLGGAPGGRDTELLAPQNTVEAVDAIVLSGGSAFGLDAAGGVQAALRERGRGLAIGNMRVPIVSQAILFDLLNGGDKDWGRFSPYRDMGYAAATVLGRDFALGSVGAGTGATTATVKGGLGSAGDVTESGHTVAAIVAVNAVGAPTIGDGPHSGRRFSNGTANLVAVVFRPRSIPRCVPSAAGARAQRSGWSPPMPS